MSDQRLRALSGIATILIGAVTLAWEVAQPAAAGERGDPTRGKELVVTKGCVICPAVNEVGGTFAPPLDAEAMPEAADPLDFVARMWRGAEAMIFMQQDELGGGRFCSPATSSPTSSPSCTTPKPSAASRWTRSPGLGRLIRDGR